MKASKLVRFLIPLLLALSAIAPISIMPAYAGLPANGKPPPPPLTPRHMPTKAVHTKVNSGQRPDHIIVRFVSGSNIRLRNGNLISLSGKNIAAIRQTLAGIPNLHIERLYNKDEGQIASERFKLQESSGKELPDLNLAYLIAIPSATQEEAEFMIDQLNSNPLVEIAYPENIVQDAGVMLLRQNTSTDYTSKQGYVKSAADNGIERQFAWTYSGGRGDGVTIIDLENGWNTQHEDLTKARNALLTSASQTLDNKNHGTAVLGEMLGDENTFGVTGIVPNAALKLISWSETDSGLNGSQAVARATDELNAGDVMVLEGEIIGPSARGDCSEPSWVPVEWDSEIYNNIVIAVAKRIVVVEAAGNGCNNLDDAVYNGSFSRSNDSEAIMVGAGYSSDGCILIVICHSARQRMDFSNYGSRVDVQGWGENVASTGYGDLYPGGSPPDNTKENQFYTDKFSGTSSASPIVAGAATSLEAIAKQKYGEPIRPQQLRELLVKNGSLQQGNTNEHIGPLPDLKQTLNNSFLGKNVLRPEFHTNILPANDDGSTGLVDIGFPVNFFGNTYTSLYVNNNGNVTFDSALPTYTPFSLLNTNRVIIAPFFADVDTREGNKVRYSSGTISGRQAFGVTWPGVGCFTQITSVGNYFQAVLIDRSDIGQGDFDIEFNYEQIQWESGTASGGDSSCQGGASARVGFSNGTSLSFELPGSATPGDFLDTNTNTGLIHSSRDSLLNGRYIFHVRNGATPTGGTISGTIYMNNETNPLSEAFVQICGGNFCHTTQTSAFGEYSISGLDAGNYTVKAFPPGNTSLEPGSIEPINLSTNQTITGQNIILTGPTPIPSGTTITSRSTGEDGIPVVYWAENLTLTTHGCSGGSANYQIVHDNSVIRNGSMVENPSGTYTATIPQLYPISGYARVVISLTCPGSSTTTIPFDIYIDPSGHVRTPDGTPIEGATVTLFRSDSSNGPFDAVPDGSGIMSVANRRNPDLTDSQGRFGWDTIAGYYKVRAEKQGCTSPTVPSQLYVETDVLTIPPAATNVDLRLACAPLKSILYMTENQGTLRRVNQSTGATTTVGYLGTNSIVGLSNRPGDTTYIYGVYFIDLGHSGLAKINTVTGETTFLPEFDKSTLGISSPTAYGIAISPAAPNIAVITGVNTNNGVHYFLWKVNVNTGTVLGAAVPTTEWLNELAYSLDGSVLYGVTVYNQLVTVDIDTGITTLIGNPGLPNPSIEGLAFRPSDGALFAIDGYDQDRLVRLDPANGSLLQVVGSLGVVGPYGLAFIPSNQLTVSKSGNGNGAITSDPAGISCGSTCSYEFNANIDVTLTATAAPGSLFSGWSGGGCAGTGTCVIIMAGARSVTANFAALPTNTDIYIGGIKQVSYYVPPHGSMRNSFAGVNNGPVKITNTESTPKKMIAAERVIYKVGSVPTSFSEMMGLPDSQKSTTYWLPWYNNMDLDTQLRFANVSSSTAIVNIYIGSMLMTSNPITLAPGESTRKSFIGINSGPVKIVSNQNIVAAERVIYKVNGTNTSFYEMMALPNIQLDKTYWLPWYNNVDLDTQLRFANVTSSTATVHVSIGGQEMNGSPITLAPGESIRKSFAINSGPVKISSNVNVVAAERVIYKVGGIPTSFSEMMALPNGQLDKIYWLPWYNNVDLDTQLRFANAINSTATVHVFIGGIEVNGSPFILAPGQSTRKSFAVNNGPVQIVSDQNIVAAERVIYKVGGIPTSFSEMMALPNGQLNTIYWLPWYNNVDLDTQLRFGVP